MAPSEIEPRLRALFERALRRRLPEGNFTTDDVEEWDSMSHVKLILEIEREFVIQVDPDDIGELYRDFAGVLAHVSSVAG